MILVRVSNRILIKLIKPIHRYLGPTDGLFLNLVIIWAPGIFFYQYPVFVLKPALQSQPRIFIVHIIKMKLHVSSKI